MLLPQWNIWVPFKGTTPVTAFLHSELPQWELITHMDTHRFWHRAASVSMWERNPESIKKASVTRGRLKIYSPGEKRNAIQSPLISLIFSQHDYSNHCLLPCNPTPKYPSLWRLCNCSILLSWKQNYFTPISPWFLHLVSSETEHFRALYRQSNDAIQFPFHYTCASVPQFNMTI